MLVRILIDDESPDIGQLVKGAERIICPDALARLLIKRGVAEEIKPNKNTGQGFAPAEKKEVKDNG